MLTVLIWCNSALALGVVFLVMWVWYLHGELRRIERQLNLHQDQKHDYQIIG